MRTAWTTTLAFAAVLASYPAAAITVTNLEDQRQHIFVCDDNCGPSHGDDWGSAVDAWLDPGESRSFACAGKCFVGLYYDDHPPTLGDMAMAEDDELFSGDEAAYIQAGSVSHKQK
jgi:hypothetical protein